MIKIPDSAPFASGDRGRVEELVSGLTAEQRAWLVAHLGGAGGSTGPLTILYGTESGNCEDLAALSASAAKKRGLKAKIRNMAEVSMEDLVGMENLLVIVSTWGEGDPPETAEEFYKTFMESDVRLEKTRFSVCALGDTSYEDFCEIGKQMDTRLEAMGAERLVDRQDCDVEFDESHAAWLENVLGALGSGAANGAAAAEPAVPSVAYGKKNPFPSEILDKVLLSGVGTKKETWHLELNLEGSGLAYEAGDALAVVPLNAQDIVDGVLKATGFDGATEIALKSGAKVSLREGLEKHLDITALSRSVAKKYAALNGSAELAALLADDNKEAFREYVDGRQIVDLFEDYPVGEAKAEDVAKILRPLPPRLYSIASSPKAHPGEVHLTVAAVRYETHGKSRKGVASTCLADLVGEGDAVSVFVQPNKRFRLPDNDDAPVIMVGPGTGIAPFRAFIEERGERGAKGESWLFFGDQHYTYDFLYQLELQEHLKSGALARLDVAFSRDQPEKVYVQDRMREKASELYAWLDSGAHFYVCGDANRMAGDVHEALLDIVAEHGGKSREEAEEFVGQLKKDGRYQRDVY